jgi:glycosyltransferase involved in cell wall biosynthesis
MNEGKISIVVPAYNAEAYVGPALKSLLRERDVDLEILVVDDGSTDGTAGVVRALAAEAPAIRLIEGRHGGVANARNLALAAVSPDSRYISFLDADDHSSPGRLARQRAFLEAHPEADFVAGLVQFFEQVDEETSKVVANSKTVTVATIQLGAFLFRRGVFDIVPGFDQDLAPSEDVDFFLRALEAGVTFLTEDKVAVLYRRHGANLTNNVAAARRSFTDAIRRSAARRRQSGRKIDIGRMLQQRSVAEETF